MKKFVFQFESVLKMRMDEEEKIGRELAVLMDEFTFTEQSLKEMRHRNEYFLKNIDQKKEHGASVYEICIAEEGRKYFKSQILMLEKRRSEQYDAITLKRAELTDAMKKRKIMEKLKEKAFEEFVDDFEREEQKIIEEIVTYNGSMKKDF